MKLNWQKARQSDLWQMIRQAIARWAVVDGDQRAGAFAYFLLLSLLPLAILLVAAGSWFVDREVVTQAVVELLNQYTPLTSEQERGTVAIVRDWLNARGTISLAALPLLLWGSLKFLHALIHTTNRIWNAQTYPWWRLPLKSLGLLAITSSAVLISILLLAIAGLARRWLAPHLEFPPWALALVFHLIPCLVLFYGLLMVYKLAPSRPTRFSDVWLGALAATLLIWLGERLFLVYAANFAHFDVLYGALGGTVAFLLWLYLSSCIGVFGICFCAARVEVRRESTIAKEDLSPAPAKVDVNPVARDEEIRQRLQSVLDATDWFTAPEVRVEEGVVFLKGRVASDELKKWAGDLARNTQDVVAVANRMEVAEPSIWDWGPAWRGLMGLWRDFLRSLPLLFLGLLILGLSVGAGLLAARKTRSALRHRIQARLLRNVIAGGIGVLVFLVGTYIVLRVSGLTQLALTVVGGTGLVGLAVGIAFRDITENFLASIFLSMQRPFETGDLVEVSGVTGYVQQLNVRTTILMALDGNLVQIPNASVYKSNLRNFTTNSNRRDSLMLASVTTMRSTKRRKSRSKC
jgi:YihY family inner membrane protein